MKKILFILLIFTKSLSAQITITDTTTALVYIFAGQSNCVGRDTANIGQIPSYYLTGNDSNYIYNQPAGTFQTLAPYVNNQTFIEVFLGRWAWGDILSRKIQDSLNRNIYIMKVAIGGTSMNYWRVGVSNGGASKIATACLYIRNYFNAQNRKYKIKGMVWYQGESDMLNSTLASAYYNDCSFLFYTIRNSYWAVPDDMPIYFVKPTMNDPAFPYRSEVRTAIDLIGTNDPYTSVFSIDDTTTTYPLLPDHQHIDSLAHVNLGNNLLPIIDTKQDVRQLFINNLLIK